tara:strand:+ start:527 stop:1006 length:480 start_codon:yes stop_codon:yes gene_type:complete
MLFIFDLDGTAIDSSHRQNTLPDGSLNLDAWRENSTPEMVARDTLLPVGEGWKAGLTGKIAIITARVLTHADYAFLRNNGLHYDFIYSRPEGDNTPDDQLKRLALYQLAKDVGRSMVYLRQFAIFFDDNASVRKMADKLGIATVDAIAYNNGSILRKAI